MMADSAKKYLTTLLLTFVLAGCTSFVQTTPTLGEGSVLASSAPTETAAFIRPTTTNAVSLATVTPYPTLMSSSITQYVDDLVSTNEICLFPCWGGIIPGKTNWGSISAFLASFAEVSKHSPSSPKGYAVYIPLSNQYADDLLWLSIYLDEKDNVKYMNGWRYRLSIDQLQNQYGKPSQVYLFVLGVLPSDNVEKFNFILSYQEQGFFVVYSGATQNQANLKICPSKINNGPYFWLWDPQDHEAMSTIVGGSSYRFPYDWSRYQEIAVATKDKITVDSFYETYSNPANTNVCFQVHSPSFP